MLCSRTPYCFQSNYGSDSYSGPSTSFNPSFERNGRNCPPSHCDVNHYHSAFSVDPRLHRSYSLSTADLRGRSTEIASEPPANVKAYISIFGSADEDSASKGGFKCGSKIKKIISKTKSGIKNRYEKSFGAKSYNNKQRPYYDQWNEQPSLDPNTRAKYFIAQIDKKLYDARVVAKKVVVKSGHILGRKPRRSESQCWRDQLDHGYANYNPEDTF